MTCGLIDIACHAQNVAIGFWEWLAAWFWSLISVNTVLVLILGQVIGAKYGWKSVAVTTAGLGLLLQRREREAVHENVQGNDATPAPRRRSQKAPPGKRVRTIFDMFRR